MRYPTTRLRRLRKNELLRNMFEDVKISSNDFILPIFVCEGKKIKRKIKSLNGHYEYSVDELIKHCEYIKNIGISSVILFGITRKKNDDCSTSISEKAIIPRAIKEIKKNFNDILVIADLCNCEYTKNGHCGIVINGDVHNDKTNEVLAKQAIVLAKSGADVIAPSDMMDGRVKIIRETLDQNGFENTLIFPYSIKYASSFYSPFREATNISVSKFDRKTYQMNYKNSENFINEVKLDINEGADAIIIKPALCFMDIIWRTKQLYNIPIISYNVSGEYLLMNSNISNKYFDYEKSLYEAMIGLKRAGSNAIISYHSIEMTKIISKYD